MSYAGLIQRNGMKILWRKMLGEGGVYDYTTATVAQPSFAPAVTIYGVLDGFGSMESQLRSEQFEANDLEIMGATRVFTTSKLEAGDVVEFDGHARSVFLVKDIWKKNKVVLYMALVKR